MSIQKCASVHLVAVSVIPPSQQTKTLLRNATTMATHLFMMDNFVQVGLELFGQQNSFQASGGNAPPVKVLHPQSTSELQLSTMEQIRLGHYWSLPISGCCPVFNFLKHLHNVETRFYCSQMFLCLDFQCRYDSSELN